MSPAQAGNLFKRQARQLAEARTNGKLSGHHSDNSSLPAGSSSLAAGDRKQLATDQTGHRFSIRFWGMIQWIIENQRYNHDFFVLAQAHKRDAKQAPRIGVMLHTLWSVTNRTHKWRMLRASDVGLLETGEPMSDDDGFIALDVTTSLISSHIQVNAAASFVDQDVENRWSNRSGSLLQRLKEEAFKYDLAYYSEQCEIPKDQNYCTGETLHQLWYTKAVVDTHGGNMHTNGFYNSFSILSKRADR